MWACWRGARWKENTDAKQKTWAPFHTPALRGAYLLVGGSHWPTTRWEPTALQPHRPQVIDSHHPRPKTQFLREVYYWGCFESIIWCLAVSTQHINEKVSWVKRYVFSKWQQKQSVRRQASKPRRASPRFLVCCSWLLPPLCTHTSNLRAFLQDARSSYAQIF